MICTAQIKGKFATPNFPFPTLSLSSHKKVKMKPSDITNLIRHRRSIFPAAYNDKKIPKEILEEILENANWAPTHRFTEPWRFKVFQGKSLESLGEFLGEAYKKIVEEDRFSPMKYKKTKKKPTQCACVIAICMQRDPETRVPEWEELAATACAVQNMWLTCAAYNIGAYWSSPKTIHQAGEFLNLKEGETCLGFFYMGYSDLPHPEGKRESIADKVVWRD